MSVVDIVSVPATFTFNKLGTDVVFAIPSGLTIISANWIITWSPAVPPETIEIITGIAVNDIVITPIESGTSTDTVAASVAQLADMQAAVGGLLSATVARHVGNQLASCSLLILELTGTFAVDHCGISPASQTTVVDIATGSYTITLYDGLSSPTVAPLGGQVFTLSDGGAGGTFLIP